MNKINLYIDNQALVKIKFDLANSGMRSILEGIEKNNIQILINPILKQEILKHLKKQIDSEYRSIQEPLSVLKALDFVKIDTKLHKLKKKDALVLAEKKYFEVLNPLELSLDDVDSRAVIDAFLNKKPPFSEGKKEEFPDAYSIESLKPYFTQNLCIISNDSDFKNYFDHIKEVTLFEDVGTFAKHYLALIYKHELLRKFTCLITEFLADNNEIVDEYFSDEYVFETDDDAVSEIEDVDVKDVKVLDIKIIELNEEDKELSVRVSFYGVTHFSISTPVYGWDGVDKEHFYLGRNRNDGEEVFNLVMDFKFYYSAYDDNGDDLDLSDASLDIDNCEIEFDDHEVERVEVDIPVIQIDPNWAEEFDDPDHESKFCQSCGAPVGSCSC